MKYSDVATFIYAIIMKIIDNIIPITVNKKKIANKIHTQFAAQLICPNQIGVSPSVREISVGIRIAMRFYFNWKYL